jgi:hypothetical protein
MAASLSRVVEQKASSLVFDSTTRPISGGARNAAAIAAANCFQVQMIDGHARSVG